jgi:L-Ala-D/L-Glu epimerase
MSGLKADVRCETWNYVTPFVIARGANSQVTVVIVTLSEGGGRGWAESCPVSRYGESPDSVVAQAAAMTAALQDGAEWDEIHDQFPAGAARNAVDCAMWDLRAKKSGRRVWELLGLAEPEPVATVFTIGLDTPDAMAASAAAKSRIHATLKVKLGDGGDDLARMRAVREAAPKSRLIVDANEGWDEAALAAMLPDLARLGIALVEQPLPAGREDALADIPHLVPIGADESCHTVADLDRIAPLYDLINIKLDKSGGLTEAMRLKRAARDLGLATMVGCMAGTSLGVAPGVLVAQGCEFVDLDAPLLLGHDRDPRLCYDGDLVAAPAPELWG